MGEEERRVGVLKVRRPSGFRLRREQTRRGRRSGFLDHAFKSSRVGSPNDASALMHSKPAEMLLTDPSATSSTRTTPRSARQTRGTRGRKTISTSPHVSCDIAIGNKHLRTNSWNDARSICGALAHLCSQPAKSSTQPAALLLAASLRRLRLESSFLSHRRALASKHLVDILVGGWKADSSHARSTVRQSRGALGHVISCLAQRLHPQPISRNIGVPRGD